jgi:hypothetical protein
MFDITISIVNWNTGSLLERCLSSIKSNCDGISQQVIVVDNNSEDQSARQAQDKHPWAEFIYCNENRGFSSGNNRALNLAKGKYFMLLNPDTEVLPGALATMKCFLDRETRAAAAGPHLEYGDGRLQRSWSGWLVSPRSIIAETLGWKWLGSDPLGTEVPAENTEVKGLMGACIMLRKEAIDRVGSMDENFFLVYEEADWCHRLINDGWSIWYLPAARVIHHTGQSSRHIPGKGLVESFHSLKYYLTKHYGTMASLFTVTLLTGLYLWWSAKTEVKIKLAGTTPETEARRERFRYILRGLLTEK